MRLAAAILALAGCATGRAQSSLTLAVDNLACADCGKELEEIALKQPGVREAHFDEKSLELNLRVAEGTQSAAIVAALEAHPIDGEQVRVTPGKGHGSYAPFLAPEPGWDVRVLSPHGEDLPALAAQAAPGKVTVIDFSAEWCGPCHTLDAHVHELLAHDAALAYRRVNVVDWDSPVARHWLADAAALPFVVVLDGRGREEARLAGATPEALDAAIRKAKEGAR